MRKTLVVVLVFGVVLLVASPAQAKPVKQRATNAAYCYEVFGPATTSEQAKQEMTFMEEAKCLVIIAFHVDWLEANYPSVMIFGTEVLSETERTAAIKDLEGRLARRYRVTPTQIVNAYPLRVKLRLR